MPPVNYLRVVGCEHIAAKGVEKNKQRLQDRLPKQQAKPMKVYLCTNKLRNQPPKITNSTSTDVTFEGAQSSRMVAKKQDCHSIALADKQINEEMVHPTSPQLNVHSVNTSAQSECTRKIMHSQHKENIIFIFEIKMFKVNF